MTSISSEIKLKNKTQGQIKINHLESDEEDNDSQDKNKINLQKKKSYEFKIQSSNINNENVHSKQSSNYKDLSNVNKEKAFEISRFKNSLKTLEKKYVEITYDHKTLKMERIKELQDEVTKIKSLRNLLIIQEKNEKVKTSNDILKRLQTVDNIEKYELSYSTGSILEKTIPIYKKMLFINSKDSAILNETSNVFLQMGDISSAITYLKSAVKYDPDNLEIKEKLESLHFAKGILMLKNDSICIDSFLSSSINTDKNKKTKLKEKGKERFFLTENESQTELSSNSLFFTYFRALAFLKVDKKELALEQLDKIIKSNQNNIEALLLTSKILLQMGKEKESFFYLWRVYDIHPNHIEVKSFVSIMSKKVKNCMKEAQRNLKRENYKCALLWLSKGLTFYPNYIECLLMRSSVFKKLKNLSFAVKDLDTAKKCLKDKDDENLKILICNTYNELALTMLNENYLSEANRLLSEAIKYSPNKFLYINKGDCFFKFKDYNTAYQSYMEALKLDPECQESKARISTVLFKYAVLCFNNSEFNECISNIQNALFYAPLCCEFYLLESKCYMKLKNKHKAICKLETALEINPSHRECLLMYKTINPI